LFNQNIFIISSKVLSIFIYTQTRKR